MSGPNTTGKPDTKSYTIGRGIVYISTLVNDLPVAYRDVGNAPEMNLSVETETLEHFSSREGLKVLDAEVTISQKVTLTLTLDEINHENLADFFSGQKATHTNVAVAGFSEYQMVADGAIEKGRWYDIVNSSNERAYDITKGDLTVNTTNVSPVTLVEGTDYEVDEHMGRIFLLSTSSAVDTAITNGEGLDVTLAAKAGALGVDEVQALTKTTVSVAMKYIAKNPNNADKQTEFQFHKLKLKAEGDFNLISDEFTSMSFSAASEKNATADADSPTLTIRTVKAA